MKRPAIIVVITFVLILVWMISGHWAKKPLPEIEHAPEAMAVQVQTSVAQPIERVIVFNGRTAAARTVTLRAQTSGEIVGLGAERGSVVAPGELVVQIDMRNRKERVAEAEARLQQSQIDYEADKGLAQKGYQAESVLAKTFAQLQKAQSDLAAAQEDLAYTHLMAPMAGKLQERYVEVGDYVNVGDKVAQIVELNPLIVTGDLTEGDIVHVTMGMPAAVHILSSDKQIEGQVRYKAPAAAEDSRMFKVEVTFANPDMMFPAGVTARVTINYSEVMAHCITPAILTLDERGQVGVKAIDADNHVLFYPVQVIQSGPQGVAVVGLPETVQLITVGQGFVRVGDLVHPCAPTTH